MSRAKIELDLRSFYEAVKQAFDPNTKKELRLLARAEIKAHIRRAKARRVYRLKTK